MDGRLPLQAQRHPPPTLCLLTGCCRRDCFVDFCTKQRSGGGLGLPGRNLLLVCVGYACVRTYAARARGYWSTQNIENEISPSLLGNASGNASFFREGRFPGARASLFADVQVNARDGRIVDISIYVYMSAITNIVPRPPALGCYITIGRCILGGRPHEQWPLELDDGRNDIVAAMNPFLAPLPESLLSPRDLGVLNTAGHRTPSPPLPPKTHVNSRCNHTPGAGERAVAKRGARREAWGRWEAQNKNPCQVLGAGWRDRQLCRADAWDGIFTPAYHGVGCPRRQSAPDVK